MASRPAACRTSRRSRSLNSPASIRSVEIPVRTDINLVSSSSTSISSVRNNPTGFSHSGAARSKLFSQFSASVVLPIPPGAAMMIILPFRTPLSRASSAVSPVGRPNSAPSEAHCSSSRTSVRSTACSLSIRSSTCRAAISSSTCCWVRAKNSSRSMAGSLAASIIQLPTVTPRRSMAFCFTTST